MVSEVLWRLPSEKRLVVHLRGLLVDVGRAIVERVTVPFGPVGHLHRLQPPPAEVRLELLAETFHEPLQHVLVVDAGTLALRHIHRDELHATPGEILRGRGRVSLAEIAPVAVAPREGLRRRDRRHVGVELTAPSAARPERPFCENREPPCLYFGEPSAAHWVNSTPFSATVTRTRTRLLSSVSVFCFGF